MSLIGRDSRNSPDSAPLRNAETVGVAVAAGTFPLTFKLDDNGRSYIAMRGGMTFGGIAFNSGGWFAFERKADGAVKWNRVGRIRAHFAAQDMWGVEAGAAVARLPEAKASNVNDPPAHRRTDEFGSGEVSNASAS